MARHHETVFHGIPPRGDANINHRVIIRHQDPDVTIGADPPTVLIDRIVSSSPVPSISEFNSVPAKYSADLLIVGSIPLGERMTCNAPISPIAINDLCVKVECDLGSYSWAAF